MIKRTIEISREPARLTVRLGQLVLTRNDQTIGSIPCEDIGVVVVDHPQASYTHAALTQLAHSGATVVLCGADHLPVALVLPLADHRQVVWRLREQLSAKRPLKKRLWQQLVQAKLRAQAANLPHAPPAQKKLLALARSVKSGDPANVEARAARVYWAHWLPGETFRRDRHAPGLNVLLNYGYTVLRAAIARTVVAAGLLPAIGLHHHNRSNAFCLADDLLEPLRPLVDARVRRLHGSHPNKLTQEAKGQLLQVLADRVKLGDEAGPLMVNLHRMVASLVKCYRGQAQSLEIPQPIPNTQG